MIQALTEWRDKFAKTMNSSKGGKSQLVQKKDLSPPEITVINPKSTRGMKPVSKRTGIFINGFVKDESPLMWIKINGENISFDENGNFSKVHLAPTLWTLASERLKLKWLLNGSGN